MTELMTTQTEILAPLMTKAEAEEAVAGIRRSIGSLRAKLVDLAEREGWRALGYSNMDACCKAEFGWARTHVWRQLAAAKVEKALDIPNGNTPEAHLRPLYGKPEEVQRQAWAESDKDGKRNAKKVEEAVARIEQPEPVCEHGVSEIDYCKACDDALIARQMEGEPDPDEVRIEYSEASTPAQILTYDLGEIEAATLKRNGISVGKAAGLFSQIVSAAENGGASWETRLKGACRPSFK